ncbi:MAG TPA: class I SAM-dependent RNA methyltransferase [Firmicutes bacterium]|nr:class I SAM-dependent RNA methyltransferase [Bacillota bacterium]
MSRLELIATATFAMEAVVARELKALGYEDISVENNQVSFRADEEAIARTNLWLRVADRVKLVMGRFQATSFDALFEQTKNLPWEAWLPANACFPVQGKSVKSQLFSVSDCQAIVKKAIVERLKQKYRRQWFAEDGPLFPIEVALLKDVVTLTIDTSGEALHKRGYRQLVSQAPLRETMAAGLISLSFWHSDRPFLDPFCGSGTLPIEAALIGRNIAPGLRRNFAAEQWPRLPRKIWQRARQEAEAAIDWERPLEIMGTDVDGEILKAARQNAKRAGVFDDIHLQQMPVSEVRSSKRYGVMITNPPYGERLSDRKGVVQLYKELAATIEPLNTWSFYILTAFPEFERVFGRVADRRRKLYSGDLLCQYYQFYGPRPPKQ